MCVQTMACPWAPALKHSIFNVHVLIQSLVAIAKPGQAASLPTRRETILQKVNDVPL
jgi:hypothetical protein